MARLRIKRKDALVFINGYSTENNDFAVLMPSLKNHKRFLIISLPSNTSEGEEDFVKYDEWLKMHSEAIENLKKKSKRLIIVGFSIGAIPALYFTSKFNADRLALVSPVLNYNTFDDSATALVRMARSTVISKGKNDPLFSLKSFRHVGTFLKNPKKNWAQLLRIRIGPLMNPANVLLLPIVTLFEDELASVDAAGGKIVNKITKRKYNRDFDFETEEEIFKQRKPDPKAKNDETEGKKNMFASMFKQIRKALPPEFANISSASVYNSMRLLAYCDKFTNKFPAKIAVFSGFYDENVTTKSIENVLEKSLNEDKSIFKYNTDQHYLFASNQYEKVAGDLLLFIYGKD